MEKYARKLKRFQYSNYGFSQTSQLLDLGSLQTSQSARKLKVDAFTGSAFKGNPAVVCLLEENKDDQWLQVLAAEFNLSETCYLTWLTDSGSAPRCCSNLLAKHLFSPKFCKH
ncbi:hypothetical protein ACFX14_007069 [Malus domestica]